MPGKSPLSILLVPVLLGDPVEPLVDTRVAVADLFIGQSVHRLKNGRRAGSTALKVSWNRLLSLRGERDEKHYAKQ
jgi:hypothetical protein